jgi:hypothetical protein
VTGTVASVLVVEVCRSNARIVRPPVVKTDAEEADLPVGPPVRRGDTTAAVPATELLSHDCEFLAADQEIKGFAKSKSGRALPSKIRRTPAGAE